MVKLDFEKAQVLSNPILKYFWLKTPLKCQNEVHFQSYYLIFDFEIKIHRKLQR